MQRSVCLDSASAYTFFFFLPFFAHQWVSCTVHKTHTPYFLVIFSLKIGLTVLFTHLKIILLQYFQFSVFSFL